MWRFSKAKTVLTAALGLIGTMGLWYACAAQGGPRFVTAKELNVRLDTSELTPIEEKRLEKVVNGEVSPCGDDVTLAEAILNPEACPLAIPAGRFVVKKIMADYNPEEVSAAYMARYAGLKGLDLPLDGAPVKGAASPLVTIVVFSDFECPYCAVMAEKLDELLRRHPDKVAVAHRSFPIGTHSMSEPAARAAFAAGKQDKFWEMHAVIFSAMGSELSRERFDVMAEGLGLDLAKFQDDFSSAEATAALAADRRMGEGLGIKGTPTVFVNGRLLEGGTAELEERISEEFLRRSQR